MPDNDNFTYIVGEEKRLADVVCEADVLPLLRGAVRAGAAYAAVADDSGSVLWGWGSPDYGDSTARSLPLSLEGEPVGSLVVAGYEPGGSSPQNIAELLREVLHSLMINNLKRKLTAEIHAGVVSRSYDELLEINRRLAASEASYRELAENLEIKVQERTAALEKAHLRLLQREKMAAIGQLAAGAAHEINNPLGFIISNLHCLDKYVARFISMLDWFRSGEGKPGGMDGYDELVREQWQALKMDFLCADSVELVRQSIDGAARVKKIVSDLKDFSHVDDGAQSFVNLNEEIDRTLSVLAHEIPGDAEIVKNYQPLPVYFCNAALLCQAFLNIILNALQSRVNGLRLLVRTSLVNEQIFIVFTDNGPGIPGEIISRIFEPFYTTRDVGSGTGMGLSVAYDVIAGHGGTIEAACPDEGGTAFTIALPLKRTG